MRVLFLAGEYPPRPGGVGDYTALLAQHLAADGLSVVVLATRDEAGEERSSPRPQAEQPRSDPRPSGGDGTDAAGVVVWRRVPRWDWRCGPIVRAAVRAARADVVHLQYQPAAFGMEAAVSWLPGWLRRREPDVRAVTTFHDRRVPYLFPKAGRLRAAVRDRLLHGSDAVVFTERADWAAAALARPAGRHWIPIGSNLAVAPPNEYDRRHWRARVGADEGTFLVVHLGFLNRSKGLETLLDAVLRLRGQGRRVRLLLVGAETGATDPTNRAYAAELERRLAVLELSDLVQRLPLVPAADASGYLMAADAAAFPFLDGASLRRGSLLAALAHGLPTVSTRGEHRRASALVPSSHRPSRVAATPRASAWSASASPAVPSRGSAAVVPPSSAGDDSPSLFDPGALRLRHEETLLLVSPGDSAALAAALARLADDGGLRSRLAAGGRALTAALAWPRIAAAHRALYEAMRPDARARYAARGLGP